MGFITKLLVVKTERNCYRDDACISFVANILFVLTHSIVIQSHGLTHLSFHLLSVCTIFYSDSASVPVSPRSDLADPAFCKSTGFTITLNNDRILILI